MSWIQSVLLNCTPNHCSTIFRSIPVIHAAIDVPIKSGCHIDPSPEHISITPSERLTPCNIVIDMKWCELLTKPFVHCSGGRCSRGGPARETLERVLDTDDFRFNRMYSSSRHHLRSNGDQHHFASAEAQGVHIRSGWLISLSIYFQTLLFF